MKLLLPLSHLYHNGKKIFKKKALRLDAENENDLDYAADIIRSGGIVAFPFNGIFGLFGDINSKKAAERIYIAKNRPKDKKLIVVTSPENIHEYAKLDHLSNSIKDMISFWREIHALGIILPTNNLIPLTMENSDTILTIWTEYKPLRTLFNKFRAKGGNAFIGTSANKSGQPTHFSTETLWKDFAYDVDAIIEADFSHLEEYRKKSTTVIDMTKDKTKLHRVGNVPKEELVTLMKKYKMPDLLDDEPLIVVKGRTESTN